MAAMSFNLVSLNTNVPIKDNLHCLHLLLISVTFLEERTVVTLSEITRGTELRVMEAKFTFKREFYKQTDGVLVGPFISPIVANLSLHSVESKALMTFIHSSRGYGISVTFSITESAQTDNFLHALNT